MYTEEQMWEQFQFIKSQTVKAGWKEIGRDVEQREIQQVKSFAENKQENVWKKSNLIRTISENHSKNPFRYWMLVQI